MSSKRRGKIFVISAASGSGKTTLCGRLLRECRGLVVSRSFTTRPRRLGEKNKRDYIFVSKEEFFVERKNNGFLEWAKVFDNYYGTPKDFVEKKIASGESALLIIDVQGAFKVRKKSKDAVLIFIMPPSLDELERRLLKRKSDGPKDIRLRLKTAKKEIAQSRKYDYIVVNDDIEKAVKRLKNIINPNFAIAKFARRVDRENLDEIFSCLSR